MKTSNFARRFAIPNFLVLLAIQAVAAAQQPGAVANPSRKGTESNSPAMRALDELQRESQRFSDPDQFGYDLVIGPAGSSPIELVLLADLGGRQSSGFVPYSVYEDMCRKAAPPSGRADYRPHIKWAIPLIVGDSYNGRRVVGTSPQMFGFDDTGAPVQGEAFQHHKGHPYTLAKGRIFAPRKFEAIIGSNVAEKERLKVGDTFRVTHGLPKPGDKPDIHKPQWTVVGILESTGTATDRDLYVPYISLYAIAEHERGLIYQAMMRAGIDPGKIPPDRIESVLGRIGLDARKFSPSLRKQLKITLPPPPGTQPANNELLRDVDAQPLSDKEFEEEEPDAFVFDAAGNIVPSLPPTAWALSAILVQSRNLFGTEMVQYNFIVGDPPLSAVRPASAVRRSLDELRAIFSASQ